MTWADGREACVRKGLLDPLMTDRMLSIVVVDGREVRREPVYPGPSDGAVATRGRKGYLGQESLVSCAIASCTVDMNWAGKMMVEFFSTEISAMVCRVRSCSATGCAVMMSAASPSFTAA